MKRSPRRPMSPFQELAIQGKPHPHRNLAEAVASRSLDLTRDRYRDAMGGFPAGEHRMEFVACVNGVICINDSGSTNVNCVWYSLECIDTPVIWIAGGVDMGNDYSSLLALVQQKVTALVCIGMETHRLHKVFATSVPVIVDAASIRDAVLIAYNLSNPGDTMLLSPACASFDQFDNYEHRGQHFKAAVRAI